MYEFLLLHTYLHSNKYKSSSYVHHPTNKPSDNWKNIHITPQSHKQCDINISYSSYTIIRLILQSHNFITFSDLALHTNTNNRKYILIICTYTSWRICIHISKFAHWVGTTTEMTTLKTATATDMACMWILYRTLLGYYKCCKYIETSKVLPSLMIFSICQDMCGCHFCVVDEIFCENV